MSLPNLYERTCYVRTPIDLLRHSMRWRSMRPEHIEQIENAWCPICGEDVILLGILGWTAHLRCQDCGVQSCLALTREVA